MATALVIVHHTAMAYGPTGGFWPIRETATINLLGAFFTVNRSFGMSLFFLIAGYLMVRSYDVWGPRAFVLGRLTRLGIPMLVISGLMMSLVVLMSDDPGLPEFNVFHMWFVEHLLMLSVFYAGLRMLLSRRQGSGRHLGVEGSVLARLPGTPAIVLFALVLGFVSAVVRAFSPIDYWLNLFGFVRVAFADVPRDFAFFILGALAYRRGWLERFSGRTGMAWLATGVALTALCYGYHAGRLYPREL